MKRIKVKRLTEYTYIYNPFALSPGGILRIDLKVKGIWWPRIDIPKRQAKALFRFLKDVFGPDKPILSFKQLVALWPGYQKLSKETQQIVREMMEGQEQGGPVGSAVPDEYKPGGRWAKPEGQGGE